MKIQYKQALIESISYLIVLTVIGLALYLNALIVQDTVTQFEAEIIGYVLLTLIIGAEVFSLYWLKVLEIEKRQLRIELNQKDKKLEALQAEYDEIKNRK